MGEVYNRQYSIRHRRLLVAAILLEVILDAEHGRPTLQGLRLVGTVLPPDHVDQPKGSGQAAIFVAMQGPVDALGGQQDIPLNGTLFTRGDSVGFTHGLQILHQSENIGVVDDNVIYIDGEKIEASLLEKTANIANVCQRRDMSGDTASTVLLSDLERAAEFVQAVTAHHDAYEGAVRLQDVVDLRQDPRQVVDPVHTQAAQDGIEGVRIVRQSFGGRKNLAFDVDLLVEFEVGVAVEKGFGRVGGDELAHAFAAWPSLRVVLGREGKLVCNVAGIRAQVKDICEVTIDVLDSLDFGSQGWTVKHTSKRSHRREATSWRR